MPYKIQKDGEMFCVHKMMPDGSMGDKVKCHPTMAEAQAHMRALYANVQDAHTQSDFLLDEFVSVKPGEPFRLFPFGQIVKNGKKHVITPEVARRFRLPHFKPAIKLGSHAETTPAGGHILGLEVRNDGLYAIPEMNDQGADAIEKGAYRYHSPEVVWEGSMEDPTTGQPIEGPLIVGDALLHMPHLGEAAALYSVEPITKENDMSEEMVTVPTSLFDRLMAKLFPPEPAPEQPPAQDDHAEDYAAAVAERDELKAKIATMEAEKQHQARIDQFAADLKDTKVAGDAELVEMLAGLTDEQAAKLVQHFKALSAQIAANDKITEQLGSDLGSDADGARGKLDQAVKAKMEAGKISYQDAFEAIRKENPELLQEYMKEK